MSDGLQAGDARITTTAQTARLGEFGGGAFGLAFEHKSGSEPGVMDRISRKGASRLFEPDDRLIGMRLEQMRDPDPQIPDTDVWIARAEVDRFFFERDCLVDRSGQQLARAQTGVGAYAIAIGRDHRFAFGDGFRAPSLCPEDRGLDEMRKAVAGRCL